MLPVSSVSAQGRFALALYGSVSGKRRHWNAGNMQRFDQDSPASAFVDVNRTFADLRARVMSASGGDHLLNSTHSFIARSRQWKSESG